LTNVENKATLSISRKYFLRFMHSELKYC